MTIGVRGGKDGRQIPVLEVWKLVCVVRGGAIAQSSCAEYGGMH